MKGMAILGSTGSIGVNALDVVASFPDDFRIVALAAGRNIQLLAEQILCFRPEIVSVERPEDRRALLDRLNGALSKIEILCGVEGADAVASHSEAEVVLSAMVGAVGLRPTLTAIKRGVTVAIANKEPLVVAGQLCMSEAQRCGATILPVDSEHSAIYQSLLGHRIEDVHRLVLTGSGGPFRTTANLDQVTLQQALHHPTWSMGPKITIDSATLMNKGLEVIEARWLFDIPAERIHILIHPESIIHSMVEYVDGSIIAQMGPPDMRLPISYAMGYPVRLPLQLPRLDLVQAARLTFESPNFERFPCLKLAYQALASGGTTPAVLNAANEIAVTCFLQEQLHFRQISEIIENTLMQHQPQSSPSLDDLLQTDRWARDTAQSLVLAMIRQ